jgi:hypothetical protein
MKSQSPAKQATNFAVSNAFNSIMPSKTPHVSMTNSHDSLKLPTFYEHSRLIDHNEPEEEATIEEMFRRSKEGSIPSPPRVSILRSTPTPLPEQSRYFEKRKVKSGCWSPEEDRKLSNFVGIYGDDFETIGLLMFRRTFDVMSHWLNILRANLKTKL